MKRAIVVWSLILGSHLGSGQGWSAVRAEEPSSYGFLTTDTYYRFTFAAPGHFVAEGFNGAVEGPLVKHGPGPWVEIETFSSSEEAMDWNRVWTARLILADPQSVGEIKEIYEDSETILQELRDLAKSPLRSSPMWLNLDRAIAIAEQRPFPGPESLSSLTGHDVKLKENKPAEPEVSREEESTHRADLKFTLTWDSEVDLDLHVIEPTNRHLFWEKREGTHGGRMEVDDVDGFGPEIIAWHWSRGKDGKPLTGQYRWHVGYYGAIYRQSVTTHWKVKIDQGGESKVVDGTLSKIGESTQEYVVPVPCEP